MFYKDTALEFREYRDAGDQEDKESNESERESEWILREQEQLLWGKV